MPTSDITNNSFATATRLTGINNAPQGGIDQVLNRTDNPFDFYRFTTSGSSNLRINLTGITGDVQLSLYKVTSDTAVPTDADRVTLRNGSTGRLAESYTSTSDPLLADVTPGTYYIKVEQAGIALPSSTYSLGVFASTTQDTISALWRNPNGGLSAWQLRASAIETKGTFTPSDAPATLQMIGAGDFDADGIDDILWKDTVKNTFVLWFMENGTVRKSVSEITDGTGRSYTRDSGWSVVGLDDIDKDGYTDILMRNESQTSGQLEAWFMDNDQVTRVSDFTTGFRLYSDWQIQGFSGDRIFWRNINSSVITTWEIGRDGIKVNRLVSFAVPQEWRVVAFQDFNNDGIADLLWRNSQSEQIALWRMSSDSNNPVESRAYALPNNWRISAVADFNGDKRQDILYWNGVSGELAVWETRQDVVNTDNKYVTYSDDNGLTFKNIDAKTDTYDAVIAKDFDGDQKADVLFQDRLTGQTALWKMDGSVRKSSVFSELITLDNVIPSINYPGYKSVSSLKATTKKQPQFTAGTSRANAFDLGVLDGSGSFSDIIGGISSSDRQDWYKFRVEIPSLITGLSLAGATIGNARIEVYADRGSLSNTPLTQADLSGVLNVEADGVTPKAPATYFIRVTPDSTRPSTRTPYTLNVTGRLGLTNLKANRITIDKTSLALDLNSANNRVNVTAFQFENNGDFAANNVSISYYISRDGIFNAGDKRLTRVSAVGRVERGIAEKVNPNGTITPGTPNIVNLSIPPAITLELPGANDDFWSQSGAEYQIIAVIDPDKLVTNERDEQRNDNWIASTAITVTRAGGLDLTGGGLTSNATSVNKTGTISGSFTIQNKGGVALAAGQRIRVKFYFTTDNKILPGRENTIEDLLLGPVEVTLTSPLAAGASLTQNYSFNLATNGDAADYWVDYKPVNATQLAGSIAMYIDTSDSNIIDIDVANNADQGVGKDRSALTITGL